MMKDYNIALVPANRQQFIDVAALLSATYQPDQYFINETSIPHVTLCQFTAEENTIPALSQSLAAFADFSIELTFATRRNKVYPTHPNWQGNYWLALLPSQLDQLTQLHQIIAKIIKTPTNNAYDKYDPHLSLFNSCDERCVAINESPNGWVPLQDRFTLVLGLSDKVKQLTEILVGGKLALCAAK